LAPPNLISLEQSGYLSGIVTQDNILAQELVQSIKKKVQSSNIVIKLDMTQLAG